VAHAFGASFLAIKDIANNELSPEPLQLEPEHTLAEECPGALHNALHSALLEHTLAEECSGVSAGIVRLGFSCGTAQ